MLEYQIKNKVEFQINLNLAFRNQLWSNHS